MYKLSSLLSKPVLCLQFSFYSPPPPFFVNSCKFFSRCHLNPNLSLLYIRVFFIHFTFFLPSFSFSFFFLSLEFCQPRVMKREENREICWWCNVPVCISLLRLLISVGFSGFCVIDSLSFPNGWLRFSNSTYRFRARTDATQNAHSGTFYWILIGTSLYGVMWWESLFDWICSNHS